MSLLSDRSDYLFVSVPQDIYINGGILPNRCIWLDDSYGSQHDEIDKPYIMRGEDVAFLMEAMYERKQAINGQGYTGYTLSVMTSELRAFQPRSVSDWLDNTIYNINPNKRCFLSPPETWPITSFSSAQYEAYTLTSNLETRLSEIGCTVCAPPSTSLASDFVAGASFSLDPINTLFREMAKLRWFGGTGFSYGTFSSEPFYTYSAEGRVEIDGTVTSQGSVIENTATGSTFLTGPGSASNSRAGWMRLIDEAKAVVSLRATVEDWIGRRLESSNEYTAWYVTDCPENTGKTDFELSASSVSNLLTAFLNEKNIDKKTIAELPQSGNSQRKQRIYVYVKLPYGLFKLTDRTAVDDLTWTWPPAE